MSAVTADVLMPIAILGSFGASLYFFTKVMTDYILKKKMIDKGYVNEDAQGIFKQYKAENKTSALKWGLIIFSGGLSLILMEYIPTSPDSPLPYGMLAVFISTGFLSYYFLTKEK